MASLFDQQIDLTYQGLVKFDDNGTVLPTTLKTLTDGTGGTLPLSLSQVETKFTSGSLVDFTGTTVTGLPADINTTYTIDSVQDGLNADIKLVDQLGNSTKVTLVAGDNVTLTNSGNDLTIDAAGGGGAAGLVSGTGTDAMISSSTLTTTAAQSSATGGIALGNGAQANGNLGVALGNGAQASGDESLAIGDQTQATQIGSVAIGQYAEASGTYSSAWGRTSYARAEGSVAFGQQAGVLATEPGGVSMGRGVVAVNSDTTHVRALYIVAPSGGTGGNGITMLSPNGTAYTLTVSNAGALVIS